MVSHEVDPSGSADVELRVSLEVLRERNIRDAGGFGGSVSRRGVADWDLVDVLVW
jgi:hypothetical protein